jgi:hypothetical protein
MRGTPLVKLPDDLAPKYATKSPRPVSASQPPPDSSSGSIAPSPSMGLATASPALMMTSLPPKPGKSCLKKTRQRVVTIAGVPTIRRVKFDHSIRVEYFEVDRSEASSESDASGGGEDQIYRPIVPKVKINVKASSSSSLGSSPRPPRNIEEALEQNRRERERLQVDDESSSSSDSSLDDNSQILNFSKERFTVSDLMAATMH